MENFILFFQEHWFVLLTIGFGLAEILILILKKRIKVDDIKTKILEILPFCISVIEKLGLVGADTKKQACIDMLKTMVKYDSSYDSFVSASIENILSTPEKKGN